MNPEVQFLSFIIENLLDGPEPNFEIERSIDEKGVLVKVTLDKQDAGRLIGRAGSTAQALRTLLRMLGARNDARYNLKIVVRGEEDGESA